MDENNKVIYKESLYIAGVSFIFYFLLQILLFIFDYWGKYVLFCSSLGYICGVLNFYLLGISIKNAINEDDSGMRRVIGSYRFIRIGIVFFAVLLASLTDGINVIFVLIPLIFPRIAIALRPIFIKDSSYEK